jgi:hypothetical protein
MVLLPGCVCCPTCWPFSTFDGVQWEADIVCSGAPDYTMSRTYFLSAGSGGGTLTTVERVQGGSFSGTLGGAIGASSTSGDITATFTAGSGPNPNPPYQLITGDLLTISRKYSLTRTNTTVNSSGTSVNVLGPLVITPQSLTIRRQCSYPGIGPAGENIFNTVNPPDGRVYLREGVSAFSFSQYVQSRNVSLSSVGLCATAITADNRERVHIDPGWIGNGDFAHTFPFSEGNSPEGLLMLSFDFPISVTAVRLVYGGVSVDWYKDGQSSCL